MKSEPQNQPLPADVGPGKGDVDGPLWRIGDSLWVADGPTVSFYGFPYPTRMAVCRLDNGGLWLWSPIEPTAELRQAVAELGEVRWLVAPNNLHHLFLDDWIDIAPSAEIYGTAGVVDKRSDLQFTGQLGDEPEPQWQATVDQVIFGGSFALEEAVFLHKPSRTLLVTDLVQRHDPDQQHGWKGWVMKLDGLVGPHGSTPREVRLSFWNRDAARRALAEACAWDVDNLVIAHGECAFGDGARVFSDALEWIR